MREFPYGYINEQEQNFKEAGFEIENVKLSGKVKEYFVIPKI